MKSEATHKSTNGKWLYKVVKDNCCRWNELTLVYFWDTHLDRWSYSIMRESELIKL